MSARLDAFLSRYGIRNADLSRLLKLDAAAITRRRSGETPWRLPEMEAVAAYAAERAGHPVTLDDLFGVAEPESEATR